jgi:ArsR family transcriptional regulator
MASSHADVNSRLLRMSIAHRRLGAATSPPGGQLGGACGKTCSRAAEIRGAATDNRSAMMIPSYWPASELCQGYSGEAAESRQRPRLFPVTARSSPQLMDLSRLDMKLHFYDSGTMETKAAVRALGALAQDTRLALFRLLVQAGPAGLAAGEIAERLGVPAPTLSFHLSQLSNAGLVVALRQGRSILYSADFEAMQALVDFLTESCCGGRPELCAPAKAARAPRAAARAQNDRSPRGRAHS